MRAPSHALGAALLCLAFGPAMAAFDDTQFCQAVTQFVRAASVDVGTWVDRTTRNDGVEISCNRKLVHFKRSSTMPASALRPEWRNAKTEEWRSAYCAKPMWREAVDNGWSVSATLTTVTGERLWFACQKGGAAFHRVIP
jgi:hypothetical protein